MVIKVPTLLVRKYGQIASILYGYIREKTKDGVLIRGVKCSPISGCEFTRELGFSHVTVYRNLQLLIKDGYIASSSQGYWNSSDRLSAEGIRSSSRALLFGVLKDIGDEDDVC